MKKRGWERSRRERETGEERDRRTLKGRGRRKEGGKGEGKRGDRQGSGPLILQNVVASWLLLLCHDSERVKVCIAVNGTPQ